MYFNMKVLQITAHFSPNLGGVETHLDDLVSLLSSKGWRIFVLTYNPLTTNSKWKLLEKRIDKKGKGSITILRIPWIKGFFYKLVHYPILEYVYLFPGLFVVTPFVLIFFKPKVIHAHGLVAGFVGIFWGKVFRKKIIISTHSIYNFPKKGIYRWFVKLIFSSCDHVLTLSNQSKREIIDLGVSEKRVNVFTYWIDQHLFNAQSKDKAKKILNLSNKFVVLFVGRLIKEKGVGELLESVKLWNKNIYLGVIGSGPMEDDVKKTDKNVIYFGRISQNKLPVYYSASDLLIVPSIHEEGFGRVIIESLSCGTPVIAANRGGIKEALNDTVGSLIKITPQEIKKTVEFFYSNPKELNKKIKNARKYAERLYSKENAVVIIKSYE